MYSHPIGKDCPKAARNPWLEELQRKKKEKSQEHPKEERREKGSRFTMEKRCMDPSCSGREIPKVFVNDNQLV